MIVVALLATILVEPIMGPGSASNNFQNAMSSGAVALVPVATGIDVLHDINRVISHIVAYVIIAGLLVGSTPGWCS